MGNLDEVVEKIRVLECPTGQLGVRLEEILEDYHLGDMDSVRIEEDEDINLDGTKGYSIEIPEEGETIRVFSTAGLDDYVEKVVDAYIE